MSFNPFNFKLMQGFNKLKPSFLNNIDTLIVLPSLSLPNEQLKDIEGLWFYEHRMLWTILLKKYLKKIVFISSKPVSEEYKKYLFNVGNINELEQRDIIFIHTEKYSDHLSLNILNNQDLIDQIKNETSNNTLLFPFIVTKSERTLSNKINTQLMGSKISINEWASKYGNHIIFNEMDIPAPTISNNLKSFNEVSSEYEKLPKNKKYLLKLNYGVSGKGNFFLNNQDDLELLKDLDYTQGCIIEEFIENIKDSPSVQGYIDLQGKTKVFATHEQILDSTGMVFQGSLFPANKNIRHKMSNYCQKVGESLSKKGYIGFFAVDFVEHEDKISAIEINLRQGGTTHPYFMIKLLTDSSYCDSDNILKTNNNHHYISNDNFKTNIQEFSLILEKLKKENLLFNTKNNQGVIFHMASSLKDFNKIGYVITSCDRKNLIELEKRLKSIIK